MATENENKCPACSATPCYMSFFGNVECSNPKCEHYSDELYGKHPPITEASDDEDVTNPEFDVPQEVGDSDGEDSALMYNVPRHKTIIVTGTGPTKKYTDPAADGGGDTATDDLFGDYTNSSNGLGGSGI